MKWDGVRSVEIEDRSDIDCVVDPVVTEFIVGVRGKEGIAMSLARALERW